MTSTMNKTEITTVSFTVSLFNTRQNLQVQNTLHKMIITHSQGVKTCFTYTHAVENNIDTVHKRHRDYNASVKTVLQCRWIYF